MKIFAETERLILRELLPDDLEGMYALDADAQVHTYLGGKPVHTREESLQIIHFIREQYVTNGIGRWAVVEKAGGAFIGWSGLKLITEPINGHTGYYDIGYRLIRQYWGKGYATESAAAALRYGFEVTQLPEIYGITAAGNLASQHVLTRIGLRFIEEFNYQNERMYWYRISNPMFTNA